MKISRAIIIISLLAYCVSAVAKDNLQNGLPLPAVPDSLRTPEVRAAYVAKHFWDEMDFSKSKYALDDTFMEQAFSNYASVLPLAEADSLTYYFTDLLDRAWVDKRSFDKLADVATLYLYETDSPVYDENLYRPFVEAILAKPARLDAAQRVTYEYRLSMLRKNMEGSVPSDFAFVDRKGNEQTLHSLMNGKTTLLIFYDPDCEDCHRTMAILDSEPEIKALLESGRLCVLAVTDIDAKIRWRDTAGSIPAGWIDACEVTGIMDKEIYEIRHTPTFYLISAGGKVVLKDKPLGTILGELLKLE